MQKLRHDIKNSCGLSVESKKKLKTLIPKNFKDLLSAHDEGKIKILYDSLISYKKEHSFVLLILLSLLYIFYHSFPLFLWWMTGTGSAITILIGAFYSYTFSIFYCSVLSTLAPLITYAIFTYCGREVIEHFFEKPLSKFNEQINKRVKTPIDLFFYIAILSLFLLPPLFISAYSRQFMQFINKSPFTVSVGQAISSLSSVDMKQQFYVPITFIALLLLFQKIVKYKYRGIAV
ncbi:SNARE associated Golgi protein, putative [Plasmodium ovale curtisi]|uniref:SNARE associated Golgi protein, putative n=1 Tax=Plasmodium ovale curtisi TaxID=864141 RepID=A0A1A8W1G1_PLAOA|nr:SNARE associated Golgi protein, putative [Plasmodium ovale curtisi]SBS95137.1 SNARE associated Golgi protein, putative [Plasmodium ovale curtisi]